MGRAGAATADWNLAGLVWVIVATTSAALAPRIAMQKGRCAYRDQRWDSARTNAETAVGSQGLGSSTVVSFRCVGQPARTPREDRGTMRTLFARHVGCIRCSYHLDGGGVEQGRDIALTCDWLG